MTAEEKFVIVRHFLDFLCLREKISNIILYTLYSPRPTHAYAPDTHLGNAGKAMQKNQKAQ